MNIMTMVLNMIGTVAFAISGAMTAIRKEMDLLGVIILGVVTAVGGGIIRDLVIGRIPPSAFRNPDFAVAAAIVSAIVFATIYFHVKGYQKIWSPGFQKVLLITDTVGLGMFTVVGVQTAYQMDNSSNVFLAVFLGTITGVGGGVLRDLLVNDKPYIFYKHVYACASIAGALVCCGVWHYFGERRGMPAGAITVIVIRMLASHYRWNLPKIQNSQ